MNLAYEKEMEFSTAVAAFRELSMQAVHGTGEQDRTHYLSRNRQSFVGLKCTKF